MATEFPTGIRPHGAGLQIRVQHQKKTYCTHLLCKNPESSRSIARALRERDELKRQLRLGIPLSDEAADESMSFSHAAQCYLDSLDVEYSTITTYISAIKRHWIPAFGDWRLSDIRPSHIKTHLHSLPVADKTKKNVLGALRGVFAWALDEELIESNPVTKVRLKKAQKKKIEVFTPREREAILGKLDGQELVYFSLLFGTGMRTGEALALRWEDIDGDYIHVATSIVRGRFKSSTKTHECRDVYLEPWLQQILREHTTRFAGEWIFLNEVDNHFSDAKLLNRTWKAALKRARIRYRIPYTCRHTRASELLTRGIKPPFAAKQLGHTLEMFFRTYATWINEMETDNEIAKLKGNWTKTGQPDEDKS